MSNNYDPDRIRNRYDNLGEEEWNRLDSTPKGRISFLTHMRFIEKYLKPGDSVLEAGAGAGRFTVELLQMGVKVTILDLSTEQLEMNKRKVREMNLENNVEQRIQGDICDLSRFDGCKFDSVVCYGGPLSYVFDKRTLAMNEMLRVVKPGGHILLSVMSLIGTIKHFLEHTVDWSIEKGTSEWKQLLDTGDLTGIMGSGDHWLHMFCWSDLKEFLESFDCEIVDVSASNSLTNLRGDSLNKIDLDSDVWQTLVKAELQFCSEPGNLDSGEHIIAVVRKNHPGRQDLKKRKE